MDTLERHKQTKHMQVEHEGAVYLCHQCDYQATEPRNPKKHQLTKHEGVRHACITNVNIGQLDLGV